MNTTTIYSPALTPRPFGLPNLKAILIQPFLILGVSLFWIVTLPIAAVSLVAIKVWDAGLKSVRGHHVSIQADSTQKDEVAIRILSGEPERTRPVVARHEAERAPRLVA